MSRYTNKWSKHFEAILVTANFKIPEDQVGNLVNEEIKSIIEKDKYAQKNIQRCLFVISILR